VADLGTILPAGASGVALVAVIGYLLRSNASDRKDYQEAVDKADTRADNMAARVAASERALDGERQIRRGIEDKLGAVERKVADLEVLTQQQARIIDSMRGTSS